MLRKLRLEYYKIDSGTRRDGGCWSSPFLFEFLTFYTVNILVTKMSKSITEM